MSSQATPDFNLGLAGRASESPTDYNVDAANKRIVAERYEEVKKKYFQMGPLTTLFCLITGLSICNKLDDKYGNSGQEQDVYKTSLMQNKGQREPDCQKD